MWFRVGRVLLVLLLSTLVLAKPSPSPSLEEGIAQSPIVLVAKYRGYRKHKIDYFSGATASYEITSVLKGSAPSSGLVALNYAFHDGSACIEPEGWTFSESLMPEVGSSWILLLQTPGTYRGSAGRLPATPENMARVKALLGR